MLVLYLFLNLTFTVVSFDFINILFIFAILARTFEAYLVLLSGNMEVFKILTKLTNLVRFNAEIDVRTIELLVQKENKFKLKFQ